MHRNQITINSSSVEETLLTGESIGKSISAPITLLLKGDLGSGKTAFVQGVARGLEVPDNYYITSPTYTLVNEYPGRLPIFHIDLYRLNGPEDFDDIGFDDILKDNSHVVAVEWAERMSDNLPEEYILIHFNLTDHESRKITLTFFGQPADCVMQHFEKFMRKK
jgi:tRNA threonylcarbamoyladenosine biosynthesis protein TsaE